MRRASSTASLQLLDPDLKDGDVFDPPAWRPGRFLQFADITVDDNDHHSLRPVSSTADRAVPAHEDTSGSFGSSRTETKPSSFVIHIHSSGLSSPPVRFLPWFGSKVAMIVTSCMTVALTALTLLTFVL